MNPFAAGRRISSAIRKFLTNQKSVAYATDFWSVGRVAIPAVLAVLALVGEIPGAVAATNLSYHAELGVREGFDSNVYLQDVKPDRTLVPGAASPGQESFVTSILPRVGLNYGPSAAITAAVSYAPEVTFYHAEPSEDYVAHRGYVNFGGRIGESTWEQGNSVTWIDGSDRCLFFGGPGGAPAIGGVPLRDRRAAFMYRGGFKLTYPIGSWFVRPAAAAYMHDFFTEQLDSRLPQFRGYENYVDRSDVNGGLDIGRQAGERTRVFVGYRYGYQDEGPLITEPGIQYDNEYHRVLVGIEGQPLTWLKLAVALGPEFHHSTETTRAGFSRDYTMLYVDSTMTLLPTAKDSIALTVRQFTQPAFASCSVYQDTLYDVAARHRFDSRWSAGAGFRAYVGDWLEPIQREDWIYTVNASVGCALDARWSAEAAYSYDWAESAIPNTAGREFTRHLVSIAVKCGF